MNARRIKDISAIMRTLKKETAKFEKPMSTEISEKYRDPFHVLISCIMSLRTKDTITGPTAKKLFSVADSVEKIDRMPYARLSEIIRPINYYRTKAKRIKEICRQLLQDHKGKVPDSFEELLKFKGVGRKTANIVMVYGFGSKSHIPVDIHVHRIPNRLGWIKTKKPEETEELLKHIIEKRYWSELNDLLVMHGQNVCTPVSPHCSRCTIEKYCKKVGVGGSR